MAIILQSKVSRRLNSDYGRKMAQYHQLHLMIFYMYKKPKQIYYPMIGFVIKNLIWKKMGIKTLLHSRWKNGDYMIKN